AVVKAQEARDNMEITGTDNVDDEGDVIEELPRLTSGLISKYVAALDDRAMARKLEVLLGPFNR
ncbi:hypothetical protein CONPUDRAFT_67860, partial [Coniophora puteana RWD-64-598 SS2]